MVLVFEITNKKAIVKFLGDRTASSWVIGSVIITSIDIIILMIQVINQFFEVVDTGLQVLIV